ncbi:MAG: hypothetical protein K2L54_01425, partial [Clostridiales bacterium]|nr:hypothetical protein [Clostridiales bacterium]
YMRQVRRLNRLGTSITTAISDRVDRGFGAVRFAAKRGSYAVRAKIDNRVMRLHSVAQRMRSVAVKPINDRRARCDGLAAVLNALDPHRIIKIGYAAVLRDKTSVSEARQLHKNDEIKLVFADGIVTAAVTDVITD